MRHRLGIGLAVSALLCALVLLAAARHYQLDLGSRWEAFVYRPARFTVDPATLARAPYRDAVYLGNVLNKDLEELSGLAASRRRDGLFFALNDSGNEPLLFAFASDGRALGQAVVDAPNPDWEDLASFEWQGQPYLVIADIGDNLSWRPHVYLHFIEEPHVPVDGLPSDTRLDVAWTLRFRFEDGPRDAEALAVDAVGEQILVLDKRVVPIGLYALPLLPFESTPEANGKTRVARRLGSLPGIPRPTEDDLEEAPKEGKYRSAVTAMDVNADASAAVVLTYKNAYRFERMPEESWGRAFSRLPQWIPVPPLRGGEAIAFGRDGRSVYVSSEKRPSPLFRFDLHESER
jgi:hypothetical protein